MLTLLIFSSLILVSCSAAAGLIASTQNSADSSKALAGLEVHPDTGTWSEAR